MRIFIDMIHTLSVKGGSTTLDTVNFITFLQQELGETGTILAGHIVFLGSLGVRCEGVNWLAL